MGFRKYRTFAFILLGISLFFNILQSISNQRILLTDHERVPARERHPWEVQAISRISTPKAIEESSQIKILCIIMTINATLYQRGPAIMNTWGSRCSNVMFSSNIDSQKYPTITVGIPSSSKKKVTMRLFRTLRRICTKYEKDYDWFFVADDDTYVIVENLRNFLKDHDPLENHYFGFPYPTRVRIAGKTLRFAHGGSGYALSRKTLQILVSVGIPSDSAGVCVPWVTARRHDEHADYNVGWCLLKLGIQAEDTKDSHGVQRFFKENPISLLNGVNNRKELRWFGFRNIIRTKARFQALSEQAISFHYMKPGEMYLFDFLLYNVSRGISQISHRDR